MQIYRYVGLGVRDDEMQVFYYFIKSENSPEKNPLMLWLSGGPDAINRFRFYYIFHLSPLALDTEAYDGSLPSLMLRPQSWTKELASHMQKNLTAQRSDWKLVHYTHQFLRKGYLLGNPITTRKEKNDRIPFAHGMGLISDELYAIYRGFISAKWVNDDSVRKSLHIREGSGHAVSEYTPEEGFAMFTRWIANVPL
ncbi:hypothetical protein Fmac_029043 [Flemingia macrophylla]|uniref:Uncharacterized protein n=1 Tax=Flemingia macrophylla TaxID=520843 RepID=A0ABD1L984_9FABA